MIILQYLASFIIAFIIFYVLFRMAKVIVNYFDSLRYKKRFQAYDEMLERDRIDEENGRLERRRLREKERDKSGNLNCK